MHNHTYRSTYPNYLCAEIVQNYVIEKVWAKYWAQYRNLEKWECL